MPAIVEITHTYDKASNRLTRYNQTATLAWSHRHEEFEYDGLHRLQEARRGVRDGQSFTHSSTHKSQQWALDMLGNWDEFKTWNVGSSSYGDVETRTHNDVNELTSRTLPGNATPLDSTYDKVGNLRTQEIRQGTNTITITYTWDAWNRLVKVEYGSSVRARYQYNGLNWRTVKRSDTSSPPNGTLNQQRVMYYNAAWQLMEELINDSWATSSSNDDHNRRMQYIWGLRYIDDIAVRRELEPIGTLGPGTKVTTWYHLTDTLFSTVAILDDSAQLVERVSYDAYGRARHHRMADLTGDGSVDQSDRDAMRGINWGTFGVGDLNRDGIVDSADLALLDADWGRGLGEGRISATDNIVGYAGYIFNPEMHGAGLYTVRHRHYSPELGRWISRDPVGYVEGLNLYQYVLGTALGRIDAYGLMSVPDIDSGPCRETCGDAFDPAIDPTGYVRCMAGCMNGLRGADCKAYCSRWPDPVERAACEAGCDASKGNVGGGCVVTCPANGEGPPQVLYGACAIAVATPVPGDEVVVGLILCGCVLYAIVAQNTIDVPIPRVEPIRPPRQGKRQNWTCTIKPRGHCPPQCQSRFIGTGSTRADAEAKARSQCYAAGCHQSDSNYNCNCGHVTCWSN